VAKSTVTDKIQREYRLDDAWSSSEFGSPEVNQFAQKLLTLETQRGLVTLALLSLTIHVVIFMYSVIANHNTPQSIPAMSTHGLLVLLSIHIAVSARWLDDIKVLNLLGMALLVVTGAALMLLAHRTTSLSVALTVGFATLFMAIPIMTWGLKESVTAIALIYVLLTFSSMSVDGRFDTETLWTLQFLVIASAVIALVLIARNVGIRKHDIRSRFELDQSRRNMERLSNIDPLTGCWNRRFLSQNFGSIAEDSQKSGQVLELALLDIDLFKSYNDTFGHQVGDQILCTLAEIVKKRLPESAFVMRLGGDEFAVLYDGGGLHDLVLESLDCLKQDSSLNIALNGREVTVSAGISQSKSSIVGLDELYQSADQQLYIAKRLSRSEVPTQVGSHGVGS